MLEDGDRLPARGGRGGGGDRRDHLAVRQGDPRATSRAGSASWRSRSTRAAARTSTTRSATCRASWPPATTCSTVLDDAGARAAAAGAQLRPRAGRGERAPRPAARADRQRQRLLRRAGLAQRVAGRGDLHLPDLPRRVEGHAAPAEDLLARHAPAGARPRAGGARPAPDAARRGHAGARPEGAVPQPRPADRRVRRHAAVGRQLPPRRRAACSRRCTPTCRS